MSYLYSCGKSHADFTSISMSPSPVSQAISTLILSLFQSTQEVYNACAESNSNLKLLPQYFTAMTCQPKLCTCCHGNFLEMRTSLRQQELYLFHTLFSVHSSCTVQYSISQWFSECARRMHVNPVSDYLCFFFLFFTRRSHFSLYACAVFAL